MEKKISVQDILSNGIKIGLKNLLPVIVNTLLWIVTCWIPYLNIGTTIGLLTGLTVKMSKGNTISMTEIFDPIYRKRMGEILLTASFVGMGTWIGAMLFFIPGMVISIAWMLAPLLVLDKETNPVEAITQSNTLTYGNKLMIFLAQVVFGVAIGIVFGIVGALASIGGFFQFLAGLIGLAALVAASPLWMGINAYIYGALAGEGVPGQEETETYSTETN